MAAVALVSSVIKVEVTVGAELTEQALITTVGNFIDLDIKFVSRSGKVLTYEVFVISLAS